MNPTCDIDGCHEDAFFFLMKLCDCGLVTEKRTVCHDCRDEMTNSLGWELVPDSDSGEAAA